MFIFTARAPRRSSLLLVLLAVCVAAAAVLLLKGKKPISEETPPLSVRTNDERVAYLASLGWEVDADPVEALRLTLPEELVEPYRSYNELQLRQGFDLTPLLGGNAGAIHLCRDELSRTRRRLPGGYICL